MKWYSMLRFYRMVGSCSVVLWISLFDKIKVDILSALLFLFFYFYKLLKSHTLEPVRLSDLEGLPLRFYDFVYVFDVSSFVSSTDNTQQNDTSGHSLFKCFFILFRLKI